MAKITKRFIDAARPASKEWFAWDDHLKGFGLRIAPSGRKTFILQYRQGGRTRRYKLGAHGALTPQQARDLAAQELGRIAAGDDPSAERQKERLAPTMAALCELFLESHVRQYCKPVTLRDYTSYCRRFIIPAFGTFRVQDVTRSDIAALHHEHRDTPYQANRTLSVLSKMFNLAEVWELRPDGSNPTRHVKKYKERRRERFLSPDEIGHLFETLDHAVRTGTETIFVANAFKLLLLTGCRLREIQTLKWSYIRGDRIFLPDAKTGPRRVLLSHAAMDVLEALPRVPGNEHVIVGKVSGQHATDLQRPWRRIRETVGLEDVRIHDLRHTYASVAAMAGHSLPMIGQLLGHTQAQTTQRYVHLVDDTARKAAADVDRLMQAFVVDHPTPPPALRLVSTDGHELP